MKTKGHIFILLAFLVLLGMIVSPVCAGNYTPRGDLDFLKQTTRESYSGANSYTYDASAIGDRISMVQFTVDTGQYVNFTIYYGTGSTVTGSAENRIDHIGLCGFLPCPITESIITLNSVSKSYQYGDIQPLFDFDIAGYGVDNDNGQAGFLAYDGNYGKYDNDLAVFYPVNNTATNLMYKIDISGSQTFSVYINHGKPSDVAGIVSKGLAETINEWVAFALALGGLVLAFVEGVLAWVIFLFSGGNILIIVGLWIAGTMAYSAMSSVTARGFDVFLFYKKFFGYQRAFFTFVTRDVWGVFVEIIATFRGIFRI